MSAVEYERMPCWWCGLMIIGKPQQYSMRGYICYMHEPCAKLATPDGKAPTQREMKRRYEEQQGIRGK